MGKNTIQSLCKKMALQAGLSGQFSNHSARRTGIDIALSDDVHETKVQQLYGHKNIQSLNAYRVTSSDQQKEISTKFSKFMSESKGRPNDTSAACTITKPGTVGVLSFQWPIQVLVHVALRVTIVS